MKIVLILVVGVAFSNGKVAVFVDETIEKITKPEDDAGYFDCTNLEIIIASDTEVFLNGSYRFLKEFKGPWKLRLYAEQFHRGQWVPNAFDRTIRDFCSSVHNPTEVWYGKMKNLQGCPMNAGVVE